MEQRPNEHGNEKVVIKEPTVPFDDFINMPGMNFYSCPSCKKFGIIDQANFCFCCGIRIIWKR